ncbi:RHS repeat domain-containing protein, partial [Shewanella xiamenensis]|uniref:RHS repeat domain-containing protein n=1 Tax=Shewanella xiamenensis TaxID=332186 RepID=UPI0035B7B5EB
DRLGSATTLADQNGNIVSQRYFDPFGRTASTGGGHRTDIVNKNTLQSKLQDLDITNKNRRGFTDHEHLNEQQLIHMNGRIYDYNLGRFMSVDPLIQSLTSTQSVNPYSYIMNNPLAGTDPTGYAATCSDDNNCDLSDIKADEIENIQITKDGNMIINTKDNGSFQVDSVNGQNTHGSFSVADIGSLQQNSNNKEGSGASEIATATGAGSAVLSGVEHMTNGKALVPPAGDYKLTGQSRGLGKLEKVKWGKVNQISLKQLTESAKAGGGFLGVIAAAAATEANSDALSNGSISEGEFEGKRNADIAMLIVAMRGGTGGAVAGAVYYVADYVFSKDDVNGWIMLKRDGVQAMGNTQSSFQELGRDMKGIRREYDSDPNGFLHKLLSVQNISIGGG